MMKRSRDGEAEDISIMATYLMLLSSTASGGAGGGGDLSRVFSCKTCNKQFSSFQALGGHRASHKKPRVVVGDHMLTPQSPPKSKTHECSICGLEFPIGQALGGHMRRHRAAVVNQKHQLPPPPPLSLFPVVKKPNNRRVLCLDLNLTPSENKFFLIASSEI